MEKVIDIEERIPSMREKRRRKTNRKFILVLVIFFVVLLVILYFQSSFSRISEIHVKGATLHDPIFYEDESGLVVDGLLWDFSAKDTQKSLKEIDSVQEVKVTRKWIRDVEINIKEWRTIAYIENTGRYQALLESGEIFTEELVVPEDKAPILSGFTNNKIKERITGQLMLMEEDVYSLISEILFTGSEKDPNNITVYMDDGYEIHAIIPTFSEKMAYYGDITAQLTDLEKGVIDMEVGTFFTPFSKIYGAIEDVEDEEGEGEGDEEIEQ